jgi:hypothetical protein
MTHRICITYPEQEKWVWSMKDTMEFWKHVKSDQKWIAGNHCLYKPTSNRAYWSNSRSMTSNPFKHRAVARRCHITTHSTSAQFPASLQVRSFTARESLSPSSIFSLLQYYTCTESSQFIYTIGSSGDIKPDIDDCIQSHYMWLAFIVHQL